MSNAQVGGITSMKITARGIIRGLMIPQVVKSEILQNIEDISMPLFKYCNCTAEQIRSAFVKEVLSAVGNRIDSDLKEKVKTKLLKKFC